MPDVVRMARERRDELNKQVSELDEFIRMADELITREEARPKVTEAEFFQARFNSGEVLPPVRSGKDS